MIFSLGFLLSLWLHARKAKGLDFIFYLFLQCQTVEEDSLRITPDMVSNTVPGMDLMKSAKYCLPLLRHVCKMHSECV